MSKTIQLSVAEVVFRVTPKGNLFPLINFKGTKDLEKMGIDSIAMSSVAEVLEMNIGKGARLRVKFEDIEKNYLPEILQVMKSATRKESVPVDCPSCKMPLHQKEDLTIKCPNFYCCGQSRGMLYRMMKIVKINAPLDVITLFFDKYVIGESTNPIDNIQEMQLLFGQIKHKNTQAREGNWIKQIPSFGKDLWALELELEAYLKSEVLPAVHFWDICNFPLIQENELYELSKIDPDKLLDLGYDVKELRLSAKTEIFLTNNITFIKFLSDFFKSFGEKTWTV